ncbi:acyl-CoA dehydrogenase family protein [Caldovatus aquaticus]|uniref:Acyl-CoA/acyl-ACP dehydrogenase n=1 Tax=Caldovatus aquaticus TaxID=2865671 RepID=A0ABS7F1X3_9PROT|nr:acyl-CoA dehydrogenase family protein [Caldovatus aquaticus]MBW8269610.1 acyl-CoA/acyl-ACP dehydrogenase [Caldovatus aquaticus]
MSATHDADPGALLAGQVGRLLAARCDAATLAAIERGEWPGPLWDALEELGLPLALVPEAMGGAGLGWQAAGRVFVALGRHGAPVPMGETMLAAALLAAVGIAPPAGPLSLTANGGERVPWGRHVRHVACCDGETVALCDAAGVTWTPGANLAGEPRDSASPGGVVLRVAPLPERLGGEAAASGLALLRACQMAGALAAALDLAVDYAGTRRQFGRPIGRFQAIQQQLAVFAGEAAAAQVAAERACRAVDRHGLAAAAFEIGCAKIVAGEAAGTGAAIAHQVFGAIGFTAEHPLHHLTRRLWSWREEAGTERYWAARLGREVQALGGAMLWPFLTARDDQDPIP